MFCSKCGTQNGEGTTFCYRCGTPLGDAAQAGNAAYPSARPSSPAIKTGNLVLDTLKTLGSGPIYLVGAIAYTCSILFGLLSSLLDKNILSRYMSDLMSLGLLDYYGYDEYNYLLNAQSGVLVGSALVGLLPSILICIAMWLIFASAYKKSNDPMTTSGLTIIKVIAIIQLVCICLLAAFYVIFCVVMCFVADSYSSYATAIFIFTIMIVLGVAFVNILYQVKLINTINTIKDTIITLRPHNQISGYVIVFCYIYAGTTIISRLFNLSGWGTLSSIATATASIAFGIFLSRYKREMSNLIAGHQTNSYPQPQPIAPPPVEPQPAPQQFTPTSVAPQPAPQQFTPTSVEPQPAPQQLTPTPVEPQPAPQQLTPTPVEPQPAPQQFTPTPVAPQPAPQQFTPTPVEPQPAPQQFTPTPVEPQPAPQQFTSTTVEPQPAPPPVQPSTPIKPIVPVVATKPTYAPTTLFTPEPTTLLNPNGTKTSPAGTLLRRKDNTRIDIKCNEFRIGKDPHSVDYYISDNSAVSRQHAEIVIHDDNFYIVDLDSTNHIYVNGEQILPRQQILLLDGAEVRLGDEEFIFNIK